MSLTTARAIIDSARTRHWAFSSLALGDGAALLFLRSRFVTHVATHGAAIEGLIGTTLAYAIPVTSPGLLVASSGSILATNYGQQITVNGGVGTPMLANTYEDGWPVHLTEAGDPYVDFSEPSLAADPFGVFGGTPGFPLPTDMIRLISVALVLGAGMVVPCDVIPEAQRFTTLPGRAPAAFVSGNRLVPVQSTATAGATGRWASVTSIQLSYVGLQVLRALDDVLNLPSVLAEALIADLAAHFAMQAKEMPAAEKQLFRAEAARCAAQVGDAALDLLNEPLVSSVQYRG
jgi:hypothetical protein